MLNIPAEIECDINGQSFTIAGMLDGLQGRGKTLATLLVHRSDVPPGFVPELLAFALAGSNPPAATTHPGAHNPFTRALGDFWVEREVDFGRYGRLRLSYATVGRATPDVRMAFKVTGNAAVWCRALQIKPTFESWEPRTRDTFWGSMDLACLMDDGMLLEGRVTSSYHLVHSDLERPQVRILRFEWVCLDTHFTQREYADLYDCDLWHNSHRANPPSSERA